MKHHNFLFVLLFFAFGHCIGQADFRYKRPVTGVSREAWYALSFPDEIFKDLNREMTDFRVYFVEEKDSVEVPYLFLIEDEEVKKETVQLPLFNKSVRDGVLYLTFELRNSQKVNSIHLEFNESNYFALVTVEGSYDKQQWFEIAKDQRIVSIKNAVGDYMLSTLNFPLTDYRFLRVSVRSDVPVTFGRASFQYNQIKPGIYKDLSASWEMRTDRRTRQSFVDIKLDHYVPFSSIEVQADNAKDYYRSFRIEYVSDSARTEKGWIKYYETVYEGHLTSFRPNKFNFKWRAGKSYGWSKIGNPISQRSNRASLTVCKKTEPRFFASSF